MMGYTCRSYCRDGEQIMREWLRILSSIECNGQHNRSRRSMRLTRKCFLKIRNDQIYSKIIVCLILQNRTMCCNSMARRYSYIFSQGSACPYLPSLSVLGPVSSTWYSTEPPPCTFQGPSIASHFLRWENRYWLEGKSIFTRYSFTFPCSDAGSCLIPPGFSCTSQSN